MTVPQRESINIADGCVIEIVDDAGNPIRVYVVGQ
jgi:hypothetical protein